MKNIIPKTEHGHTRATIHPERVKNTRREPSHIVLLVCLVLVLLSSLVSGRAGGIPVGWGGFTSSPTNVPANLTNAIALAASSYRSHALRDDGTTTAWGATPTDSLPGLTNAIAIASGYGHDVALRSDGSVVAWGVADQYGTTNVPADLTNVLAIAAGGYHSLALKADGTVAAWGEHVDPGPDVPADLTNVVAIATADNGSEGVYHSLALKSDGTVVVWGNNFAGQLDVPEGLSNVVAIACGEANCYALQADGTLQGWGSRGEATPPPDLPKVVAVAAGGYHTSVLKADGTVFTWGSNYAGQANVPPDLANVVAIAAGTYHTLALVAPPRFVSAFNPAKNGTSFSVSVSTRSGHVYRLEHKTSLADTSWTPLPLAAGTGAILTLTDPSASDSRRFYRIREW